MNIEAMRRWAKHDQGHASTFLSLEDARLIVELYDLMCDVDIWTDCEYRDIGLLLRRMEGV